MSAKPEPGPDDEDRMMSFWEHLEELRKRLVYMFGAFAIGGSAAWTLREPLLVWLTAPFVRAWGQTKLGGTAQLHFPAPQSLFLAYVKMSFIRFVSNGPCGPKTLPLTTQQGDMTVAAPSKHVDNSRYRQYECLLDSLREFVPTHSVLRIAPPKPLFPHHSRVFVGHLQHLEVAPHPVVLIVPSELGA